MSSTSIAGIETRYEVMGSGPPLLMYAPGGFDATIEKWSTLNVYARIKLLEHLPRKYTCIAFDRRECGQSGGRVEPVSWKHFVEQGKGLLDHLGLREAYLIGGCMGCSCAIAFAAAHPEVVLGMILWWPVGGAKYRIKGRQRFFQHLEFVDQAGLRGVVDLVAKEGKPFNAEPRGGPWASVIKRDADFARAYAAQDVGKYKAIVTDMALALLDRDTSPGAEPEQMLQMDIPALVIPGRDDSHATSAARYLEECLPKSQYWDAPVAEQTEEAAARRLLDFLDATTAERDRAASRSQDMIAA
jgi:pimeloyl-ACP methyl ester carboxylesterase